MIYGGWKRYSYAHKKYQLVTLPDVETDISIRKDASREEVLEAFTNVFFPQGISVGEEKENLVDQCQVFIGKYKNAEVLPKTIEGQQFTLGEYRSKVNRTSPCRLYLYTKKVRIV